MQIKGITISNTEEHPYWVVGKGWVEAKDLKIGDQVLLASGEKAAIENVTKEKLETPVKVYNFGVADWHTYFVAGIGVLVHNDCTANGTGYSGKLPSQGKVNANINGAPKVDAGKQGKHVPGHGNNVPTKSQWPEGQNGVQLTQEAWMNGTPVRADGSVKIYDLGKPVGPNGETRVKVHIDKKGNIHGYPVQ